jgi:hypothetical protein
MLLKGAVLFIIWDHWSDIMKKISAIRRKQKKEKNEMKILSLHEGDLYNYLVREGAWSIDHAKKYFDLPKDQISRI